MQPAASCNVTIPKAEAITPSQRGQLPLSTKLSTAEKDAIMLPQLKSSSTISLGQLCEDDCNVLLNKTSLKLTKNNEIALEGIRNNSDVFLDTPIYSQQKILHS